MRDYRQIAEEYCVKRASDTGALLHPEEVAPLEALLRREAAAGIREAADSLQGEVVYYKKAQEVLRARAEKGERA